MPGAYIKQVSGLDRGAFNPLVAAAGLWMESDGQDIRSRSLEGFLVKVFPDRIVPGYLRRFERFEPGPKVDHSVRVAESTLLAEDAMLGAGAALRKILISVRRAEVFNEDEDFETDPAYARSAEHLEQLRADVDGLATSALCECPKCSMVGGLQSWFGMRTIGHKRLRQSWCRVCRTFHGSSAGKPTPTR